MKKILIFLALSLIIVIFSFIPARTQVKSYYSGDAINYNNRLVVASTDSESLEIFILENDGLKRQMNWRPFNKRFNREDSFYSIKLNIENNRLYAYVISEYTIYKYDISQINKAVLIKESKNTYWEWYSRVDKFGDNIVTISAKGVKIFNNDLEVIDSYEIVNEVPYNISSGGSDNLIFNINEHKNEIQVFDRQERRVVKTLNINFYGKRNNKALYYNDYDASIYFADDRSVKKVNSENGSLKNFFEHLGYPGFDVVSSGNDFIYFANGLGVVKLRKDNMSVVTSKRTGSLTVSQGWAMGLKAVAMSSGEKVVVFNNSSIIVMNDRLDVLGYFVAGEDDRVYPQENLFLNLNSSTVDSGTQVEVSGGGYFPNEDLIINFYGEKYYLKADNIGRFKKVLVAPDLSESNSRNRSFSQSETESGLIVDNISERVDIKVDGQDSLFTYSIGLEIKDLIIRK
ncbi:MAG: hypothetical protein PHH27_03355 [Candidatus Colwellbacteria bacterium]|nr:hypothetical protein [Candidatus Colwellbacteria bacterium]